jgi:hypothetical protein
MRPVAWARELPCPTLRKVYEEDYQTDTLVSAIQNASGQLRGQGFDVSTQEKRLTARRVTASRLAESESVSLAAISAQGKAIRFQLNKVYAALQDVRAERQRLIVLGWAAAATVFVLIAIALGWRNSLKGQGRRAHSRASLAWTGLTAALVFVLFASPLFSVAPPETPSTEEEAERQAAVDQAARVTDAADHLSAQGWVLGSMAAQRSVLDADQSAAVLAAAIQASTTKGSNSLAYWGQTQAVRESAAAWRESTLDLADYASRRVEAAAGQSWELRAVAAIWVDVDKARSLQLLETALSQARRNPDPYYRDLGIRSVAVVWARLDPARGETLLDEVADPMLRAWGLREIGAHVRAAEVARRIDDPYDRAWALREIARVAPAPTAGPLFAEAVDAASKVENAEARSYALADIAGDWSAVDSSRALQVLASIDAGHPTARTLALHRLAATLKSRELFIRALAEAAEIGEPYATAKWSGRIVADYAQVDPTAAVEAAGRIGDAFFRDLAYRDIVRVLATRDAALARSVAAKITSPGLRVQSLAAAGSYQEALTLVDQVEDTHCLRELGIGLAATDPKAALVLVDKMDDNGDRAAVLLSVAVATGQSDPAQSAAAFERAVREAKAIRVRGEPFAAARALSGVAQAYAPLNKVAATEALSLAVDLAKKVNVKY